MGILASDYLLGPLGERSERQKEFTPRINHSAQTWARCIETVESRRLKLASSIEIPVSATPRCAVRGQIVAVMVSIGAPVAGVAVHLLLPLPRAPAALDRNLGFKRDFLG